MNAENNGPNSLAPTLSDAATGSPSEYTIGHVRDFLKVPTDRLDECLSEFKDYLGMCRSLIEMTSALAELKGIKGNVVEVGDFTWIDDGEKKTTIELIPMENDQAHTQRLQPEP